MKKKNRNKAMWVEILSEFPGGPIIISLMYQYVLEHFPSFKII